jgi:hypothetical protein
VNCAMGELLRITPRRFCRRLREIMLDCEMGQFPRECLRGRITPEEFLRDNPLEGPWLEALQPGDEIWRYLFEGEGGGQSGYVVLRDGIEVKMYTDMHWKNAARHIILMWEGQRPSLREIIAVRNFDKRLRDKPIHEVRRLLENAPYWDGGEAWSYELPKMEERAERLGLRYEFRLPWLIARRPNPPGSPSELS